MSSTLFFDPDHHPDDTIKAFNEFVIDFVLRYDASYPDPPKVSLDSAITRWKIGNDNQNPNQGQYDTIVEEWRSKDKVAKFLGLFSSRRLYSDWCSAEPDEAERKAAPWNVFVQKLQAFYKPTENLTLKHYQFRSINQEKGETFIAFCNKVEKEAKHCELRCISPQCTAEAISIRDQIIIGTSSDLIREEGLRNSWGLSQLRKEGMRLESAAKSASEISREHGLNKLGRYSWKNNKKKDTSKSGEMANCYFCGFSSTRLEVVTHAKECPAKRSTCSKCKLKGHYAKVCRSQPALNEIAETDNEINTELNESVYNVNIFRIKGSQVSNLNDFKAEMVINNHLDTVLADTGAAVSVCGSKHAKKWGLLDRITKSRVKIKPYKSEAIPTLGTSICAVSVGNRTVPVSWHIIAEDCEPVLAGNKAVHLGLIQFKPAPKTHMPINMIKGDKPEAIQDVLASHSEVFSGIGKLKDYTVKLHVDDSVKPVAEPPRRIPYHLTSQVEELIGEMLKNDIIEEHPQGEAAPWVSNIVTAPKDDGEIRITLDAKNVNKALLASNYAIPRQEDIKAKLAGAKVFSKLDLKSAYWQLEINKQARNLTVFHALGKMYRYKRLVMGLKPAQGELNAAMQPLFAHLPNAHIIHDDLILATVTQEEHDELVKEVMRIISENNLTLNYKKCVFTAKEIKFWGLIISAEGVRPDPSKVEAVKHFTAPNNKEELISFLCMMQSNADFMPGFAKKASVLRELTKKSARFTWKVQHEQCFQDLLASFKKDMLLQFFDGNLPTFVFVDAHETGLSAILAQGESPENARPVALASRSTSLAERNYPQIDLEASSMDFGLRRFREYLVGSPITVTVVTDHKPLLSIFNGRRRGSIRTQRIKLNHQDIPYSLVYRKGKTNIADYMSRHSKPLHKLSSTEQKENQEISNLLYMLHSTQVVDYISIGKISEETRKDKVLCKIQNMIRKGQRSIPKNEDDDVRKFDPILQDLTLAANGIILKDDRLVLPTSLQPLAIELAHRGSHPGRSGIERRLRYLFFFHNMFSKVKDFVQECDVCSVFVDKKTKEPIRHHQVPNKCWETVALDLFGPMPSSKHVVVLQDLGSKFPAAKLVSSTKAEKVIPALERIYDAYGNPENQISDNGPPFNSYKMKEFTDSRGIAMRTTPPHYPNANPAETFLKTVGKIMKSAHYNKLSNEEELQKGLSSYRQTPHPATGVPPGAMLFRDGMRDRFPRTRLSDKDVKSARLKDMALKSTNQNGVNASKYRVESEFLPGQRVLIRNFQGTSKFDPKFSPMPYTVISVNPEAKKIVVESTENGSQLIRHPDDIKPYHGDVNPDVDTSMSNGTERILPMMMDHSYQDDEWDEQPPQSDIEDDKGPRRSERQRVLNQRYFNDDFVNG